MTGIFIVSDAERMRIFFGFVMQMEGCGFKEAFHILGGTYGQPTFFF